MTILTVYCSPSSTRSIYTRLWLIFRWCWPPTKQRLKKSLLLFSLHLLLLPLFWYHSLNRISKRVTLCLWIRIIFILSSCPSSPIHWLHRLQRRLLFSYLCLPLFIYPCFFNTGTLKNAFIIIFIIRRMSVMVVRSKRRRGTSPTPELGGISRFRINTEDHIDLRGPFIIGLAVTIEPFILLGGCKVIPNGYEFDHGEDQAVWLLEVATKELGPN